ncbi:hypothetical protein A8H35_03875 [Burkholderia thailandensis]|nr:hypothetical protein WJ27_02745 [Burkholderia thailandensis]AVR09570.1 hypothetical protein A8H31_19365 [Burkholderia thailandensis]AWY57710.1 hypothetical protein A8H35_03875 [Burkholderia thailandensis]KVG13103.1 hypothetical protein WJ25_04660 [Burkholderia thailandensis]KVG19716.1 hypothetical protein WJ28_04070 [Burkholderia thailandensis]
MSRNRALATRELRSAWPRFMVTHGFECGSARRLAPGVFFAVRRSIFDAQAQHAPIAAPKKKRLAIFASRFPCRPIEAEPASRIRPAASPRQAG